MSARRAKAPDLEDDPQRGKMVRSRVWFVYCYRCREQADVAPGPDTVGADEEARSMGWATRNGQWVCPACAKPPAP